MNLPEPKQKGYMMKLILTILVITIPSTLFAKDVFLPVKGKYEHEGSITEDFDKFKETETKTFLVQVSTTSTPVRCSAYMFGTFGIKEGKLQSRPNIAFMTKSREWINLKSFGVLEENKITALVDNKKIEYSIIFHHDLDIPTVTESSILLLTYQDVADWCRAEKVELQIGHVELIVSNSELNVIRDWSSRIPRGTIEGITIKDDPKSSKRFAELAELKAKQAAEMNLQAEIEAERKKDEMRAEEAAKNARFAKSKVTLAKKLIKQNNSSFAKRLLKEAVEKYPGTEGAKEAASLLETLD